MYTIKLLPEFDAWFDSLKDPVTRARLVRRLEKAAKGLLGDVQPVGGGTKSTQSGDIRRVKELARALQGNQENTS